MIFFNMTQRIQYEKTASLYSDKVLVGDWVNKRLLNSEEVPQKVDHITTYTESYTPKPPSKNDPAIVWDQKLNTEESNFISQIGRNDYPNFFENFSSTYDLAFNHFPKCYKSYIPRTLRFRLGSYEPSDDYIPTFGNLTKYGLLDYKKAQWACEIQDPRKPYSTSYWDDFKPPELGDYKFHRSAIPLANSSAMHSVNKQNFYLKLRDQPIRTVTDHFNLVLVPRKETCNPITWECPPERNSNCFKKCI